MDLVIDELFSKAEAGDIFAMESLSVLAMQEDLVVEAFYWAQMAELLGHYGMRNVIPELIGRWRRMGCPDQSEFAEDQKASERQQFGLMALLYRSGVDGATARHWFMLRSNGGDPAAKVFLMSFSPPDTGRKSQRTGFGR